MFPFSENSMGTNEKQIATECRRLEILKLGLSLISFCQQSTRVLVKHLST